MIYVFDSSPLIHLFRYYYPGRFPSLWENFDSIVSDQRIISVWEVKRELEGNGDNLSEWVNSHSGFFLKPSAKELNFVTEIFKVPRFQGLVKEKARLKGKPVADPFVIAKAKSLDDGCVVTLEVKKTKTGKIPNVCEYFSIPCLNVEEFMELEKWRF